jgi:carbonic anhydrase/SulP family sulfate permease
LGLSDFSSLPRIQAFVDGLKPTSAIIGLGSLVFLLVWDRIPRLKSSLVPAPLLVVIIGGAITLFLQSMGIDENSRWSIPENYLVEVPVAEMSNLQRLLTFPDWSALTNPNVYVAAIVIAVVSSLNTLINLKSIENIDPEGRVSPKNRELFAQGAGNIVTGLIGGLPVTSVIIRSSVNLNMGVKTRMSTVLHGILLVVCVLAIPGLLNAIPLSSLAAFLIVTGFKLASVSLFRQMWSGGMNQFLPFIATVAGIVFVDLLSGLMIGMGVGLAFVLKGAIQTPYSLVTDDDAGVTRYRVRLSNQVTFLNQAKLSKTLDKLNYGSRVILDATMTHHLDPCIETLLIEFITKTAPEHDLEVSFEGFEGLPSPDGSVHFGGDAVPPESGSGGSS